MFGTNRGPSPEEFWHQVEAERGEKVIKYSLAQYQGGWGEVVAPRWGLVYVTDSAFCFRTFPQRNWLSSLLGGGEVPGKSDELEFCIPRSQISAAEFRKPMSLLKKIFAPDPPTVRVACRDEYQAETTVTFQIDPGAREFAAILSVAK